MRIKRGVIKKRRHSKVLKLTKGYRGSYGRLYKRSKEALLHAGQYSLAHRRHRRSQIKSSWLAVINAALVDHNLSYSKFKHQLQSKGIILSSKMLSQMALTFPADFAKLVEQAK